MPDNSANKPAPAQDTRSRQHSPAPRKRRGFATLAGLALLAVIGLLCWSAFEYYAIMTAKDASDTVAAEISRKAQLFRDIVILCLAVIGIAMAFWRNASLDGQSKAANEQAKLASSRLYSDQFANAVELMAKETTGEKPKPAIAARTGGIYILADLATKKPKEFAGQVVKNLIAYIKENAQLTAQPPLEDGKTPDKPRTLGGDVKAAFSVLHDILGNKTIKEHLSGIGRFLDFSYQDFSGLDFLGIELQHYRKWTKTDFRRCRLVRAHFKDADIQWVDFSNANLSGATLENVVAGSAIMTEANLVGAIMPKINLSQINLRGANLSRANLQSANLSFAKMHGARMYNTNLNKMDGGDPARLNGADLHGANMTNAELRGANLQLAQLWGVDLTDAALHDADLASASFRGACMVNAKIDDNELTEKVKAAMNGMVMHDGMEELADVDECDDDFDWRLKSEYYDSYALNGVLSNFARIDIFFYGTVDDNPARLALRQQAWEIRDYTKMPPKWREWLEDMDPETGEHPEDNPEDDDMSY